MAEETFTMSSREVVSLVSDELTVTFLENFVKTKSKYFYFNTISSKVKKNSVHSGLNEELTKEKQLG